MSAEVSGDDLLVSAAELVAIPSVSHSEALLADHIEARLAGLPWLHVDRVGDNLIARTEGPSASSPRLILAGHLDTVPPAGNSEPSIEEDTLWGVGAADMKGGLAVMLALAAGVERPGLGVTYVFYVAEEVERRHNGLLAIAEQRPELLEADAAVLGEPTAAVVEAGCQGVVKLEVTLGGKRAHTARPWTGLNAIHRLGPLLDGVARFPQRCPVLDGCQYREALQAVLVSGGVAANVVPDRVTLTINHRFSPDRDVTAASGAVLDYIGPYLDPVLGDRVRVTDSSPAALPNLAHPMFKRLLDATGSPPRAKLGWTDVAFFAERGLPAINFGPGDPELAHRADERVPKWHLEQVYQILHYLITQAPLAAGGQGR